MKYQSTFRRLVTFATVEPLVESKLPSLLTQINDGSVEAVCTDILRNGTRDAVHVALGVLPYVRPTKGLVDAVFEHLESSSQPNTFKPSELIYSKLGEFLARACKLQRVRRRVRKLLRSGEPRQMGAAYGCLVMTDLFVSVKDFFRYADQLGSPEDRVFQNAVTVHLSAVEKHLLKVGKHSVVAPANAIAALSAFRDDNRFHTMFLKAARKGTDEQKMAAIQILREMPFDPHFESLLLEEIEHGSQRVALLAVRSLAPPPALSTGGKNKLGTIAKTSKHYEVRRAIYDFFWKHDRGAEKLQRVIIGSRDSEERVRYDTVERLGSMVAQPQAFRRLCALTRDPSAPVALSAISTLTPLVKRKAVRKVLLTALRPSIAQAIFSALRRHLTEEEVRRTMMLKFTSFDRHLQDELISKLISTKPSNIEEFHLILKGLNSQHVIVRSHAASMLPRFVRQKQYQPLLLKVIEDTSSPASSLAARGWEETLGVSIDKLLAK